jgi:hypothetical protein
MANNSKKSKKNRKPNKPKKKNSKTNSTNSLLKKLINIEKTQEKYIKELLDIFKENNTAIKIPEKITETKAEEKQITKLENIKIPQEEKLKENGLAKAEREISLDIPSLKIKDKFELEDEVKEKVKNFEKRKKKKLGLFGGKKELDKKTKLKKLALENMKKLSKLNDERKQIIGISYILRQFLEVKFGIAHTLKYSEIVEELKSREIENTIRLHLIDLFNKLPKEIYSGEKINISLDFCFNLANQTIQELSKFEKINEINKK